MMVSRLLTTMGILSLCLCLSCTGESALESVAPPEDLDELDTSVRDQFIVRWSNLEALKTVGGTAYGRAWGELGLWFHAYKFNESAATCYRNASVLDDREPRWPYYLASLAQEAGNLEGAMALLKISHAIDPGATPVLAELGDLTANQQDLESAESFYAAILNLQSDHPAGLLGMAKVMLDKNQVQEALAHLEQLAALQPKSTEVQYLLGTTRMRLGDRKTASAHFEAIPEENLLQVPINRKNAWQDALTRLRTGSKELTRFGSQALQRGDLQNAAKYAGQAVLEDPTNAELRVNYAVVLKRLKRPAAALEQLKNAIELDPNNGRAHLVTGLFFIDRRNFPEAARYLEKATQIDPRSPHAHAQLGRVKQLQGHLDEAREHYAFVRGLDNPSKGARFWHAALLLAAKKIHEGQRVLAEDMLLAPEDREVRLLRARSLVTAPTERDHQAARLLLSVNEETYDVFFAETAAMIAAEAGAFKKAVAWQESALHALNGPSLRGSAQIARRRLALYRQGEPCRQPWETTEALISKPVELPEGLP